MRAVRVAAVAFSALTLTVWVATRPALAQEPGSATGRSGQSEASLAGGTSILAELNSGLDSKKAKTGDTISAKTLDAVKSADSRTILPKGTKLVGHLTQASARSKGDGESLLGIAFDKAILKDGSEMALSVKVQAIAEAVAFSGNGMVTPSSDTSTLGTQQTSPMGNGRMGPPSSPPPPGVSGAAPEGETSASAGLNAGSRGVIGLRGLKLSAASVEGKMVSTVSSDGKNVHLDSGTRFLLVTLAGASAEEPGQ